MQVQKSILSQKTNQHYLHYQQFPHSSRNITKSYNYYDGKENHDCIAIANHNILQIYEIKGNSIVYTASRQFMCDITIMEIIKNKGNHSDWVFIADSLGRYMFWDQNVGQVQVNNEIHKTDFTSMYFQKSQSQEKSTQYSGVKYHHNVYDTEASLFYTVDSKVIFLDMLIRKGKILYRQPPLVLQIPYDQIIFVGLIDSKQNLLGIVANKEEKTFLYIHRFSDQFKHVVVSMQKPTLKSFLSHTDELIIVTTSQISIYKQKQHNTIFQLNNSPLCNFQISQEGYVCLLQDHKYLFISEVCQQMIVFSHKHYKNYGSFVLDNDICIGAYFHGMMNDGGYLISLIDQGYTIQFISVYQQQWKSVKSIQGMSPIFTIQDIQGRISQNLAVTRISDNFHQIGILSKRSPCKLKKQTQINKQILSIFSINKGKAILLCTSQDNIVYIFDQSSQTYELGFELLPGDIILATDKFLISSNKIYEIDLDHNRITQKLQQKQTIVSANFGGKYIGYQTEKLKFKYYNTETDEIDRIRTKSCQQYIWKFHSPQTLLVGSFQYPDRIQVLPIFQPTGTNIMLNTIEIISDICCMGELIAVSFHSPCIQIYSIQTLKILYSFNTANHSMNIIQCNSSFLAYSTFEAYYFHINQSKPNRITSQPIQFDSQKQCISCVHNGRNGIIMGHQTSIALYQEPQKSQKQIVSNFRVAGVSMGQKDRENQEPPLATYYEDNIYIVNSYEIVLRNIQTAQLIKKQSHNLKEVECIQKLPEKGLLLCGIDDMENIQLLLISFKDLQILLVEPIGKKIPTVIKCTNKPNQFFIRIQQYVSLYQIVDNQKLKLKFSSKTGLYGYTLALNLNLSMLIVSDPLRYVVAYDYIQEKLIPIARYRNSNTLNDIQFIQNSVICSDNIGNIKTLQFNMDSGEINQNIISEVGSLKVSQDITYLGKGKDESLIYSGSTGGVGRILALNKKDFEILKEAERSILNLIQKSDKLFSYGLWRRRNDLDDKIIDDFLIKRYLESQSGSQDVNQIWKKICDVYK